MYCSFCGKEIPDGSTFCGYCGKKLVYLNAADEADSRDESYDDAGYEGLEPVFVAPHWNMYRPADEWDEEELEEDAADEPGDVSVPDSADEISDIGKKSNAGDAGEPSEASREGATREDADGKADIEGGIAGKDEEAGKDGNTGKDGTASKDDEAGKDSAAPKGSNAPKGNNATKDDGATKNDNANADGKADAKDDESAEDAEGDNAGKKSAETSEGAASADGADPKEGGAKDGNQEPSSEDDVPQGNVEYTVRPVSHPISDKTYLKEVSSGGVHVPSQVVLGESAPRKRVVPIGLVVVIVVAALLAGSASAYAVFQYDVQNGGLIFGLSQPEPAPAQPAPSEPVPDADDPDAEGDELGAPDSLVAEDPTAADEPEAANEPAAVETGFSSAKKLITALEVPVMDGLVANLSDATMRLLVIDELDFMYPPYALALANESGCSSLQAYSRTVVDEQARELSKYAGTWSFKLDRGSKCSARTIERIQRQFQILGVDITITKAVKIEAVTGSYPADYNSENVDDEGQYHQVTSYIAVQIDGRWYLFTDALVVKDKDQEE